MFLGTVARTLARSVVDLIDWPSVEDDNPRLNPPLGDPPAQ